MTFLRGHSSRKMPRFSVFTCLISVWAVGLTLPQTKAFMAPLSGCRAGRPSFLGNCNRMSRISLRPDNANPSVFLGRPLSTSVELTKENCQTHSLTKLSMTASSTESQSLSRLIGLRGRRYILVGGKGGVGKTSTRSVKLKLIEFFSGKGNRHTPTVNWREMLYAWIECFAVTRTDAWSNFLECRFRRFDIYMAVLRLLSSLQTKVWEHWWSPPIRHTHSEMRSWRIYQAERYIKMSWSAPKCEQRGRGTTYIPCFWRVFDIFFFLSEPENARRTLNCCLLMFHILWKLVMIEKNLGSDCNLMMQHSLGSSHMCMETLGLESSVCIHAWHDKLWSVQMSNAWACVRAFMCTS